MKTILFLTSFMVAGAALASGEDWSQTVHAYACGYGEAEAEENARTDAAQTVNFYQSVCDGAEGSFSTESQGTSCTDNPQDITCPVECSVTIVASCAF